MAFEANSSILADTRCVLIRYFKNNRGDLNMNSIANTFYKLIASPFKSIAIIWTRTSDEAKIQRIFLSNEKLSALEVVNQIYPYAEIESCQRINEISDKIVCFLYGEDIRFSLDILNLNSIKPFQKNVLLEEHGIPRGGVTTYQRLAAHLGNPNASRAVGNALKNNPFPIIIPCHRAIRSDGTLGGFQGGVEMKRALLEMEGMEFGGDGKVLVKNYFF